MHLPRNAQIWLPGFLKSELRRIGKSSAAHTAWLAVTDHYEPLCQNAADEEARRRVALWRQRWPEIAGRHADSAGNPPKYSFFYPQEEYRPWLVEPLAEMTRDGIADVEIHIHHDNEGRQNFLDRMNLFIEQLHGGHGLLRRQDGRIVFGFIHGNWALDNSLPSGRFCGLNDELTLLRDLGCYADFTLPSAPSAAQTRTVNSIYWATDDPARPKSHDTGVAVRPGEAAGSGAGARRGDLLMIQGPLGVRGPTGGRWMPRLEMGELAAVDPPNNQRVRLWLRHAPRLGGHTFVKLFSHGTQDRNSSMLLGKGGRGGLDDLYTLFASHCRQAGLRYRFVSAWEMYQAVEAIRHGHEPQ